MKDWLTQLVLQALWKGLHECRKGSEKILGEEKRAVHFSCLHPLHNRGKLAAVVSNICKKTR